MKEQIEKMKTATIKEKVAFFNETMQALGEMLELAHPVTRLQLIPVSEVIGNDYNPNRVAPPEMKLLELSIRKDGITMPIVVAKDKEEGKYVVVDGFHRTTIVKKCQDIYDSLCGYIPVVTLEKGIEDRMTSTIRHNIARGSHIVELTAKLVVALKKHNWTNERISMELGMDPDEVLRLKQMTGLAEAFADKEFSMAWK